MVSKTGWVSLGIVILMIALLVYNSYLPGKYDAFAQCLEEKGAIFYGAYWCPHCKDQKELFGRSVSKLPYIECAMPGTKELVEACQKANIEAFPTWTFSDGTKEEGVFPLTYLAQKTGCKIEEEKQ
ncbi:hypothetical protein HY837_04300 [archaeon]|nr:hypothetical protein [archaeon]